MQRTGSVMISSRSWVVVASALLGVGCDVVGTGFESLPALGVYRVSVEEVEAGCDSVPGLATAGETVAIEALSDDAYAELRILLPDPDDTETDDGGDLVLGRLETATFYARRQSGPTECDATVTQEFFGAVASSVEITASTRWSGLAACDGIATPGWELPRSDCDTTEIYDFVLDEACEDPCHLEYQERVILGVPRDQATCSCPDAGTEGGDESML